MSRNIGETLRLRSGQAMGHPILGWRFKKQKTRKQKQKWEERCEKCEERIISIHTPETTQCSSVTDTTFDFATLGV
jgi:hypothetical protein